MDKEGTIVCWNYSRVIEGDLLKEYKSFKFIIQGSLVHWTLKYKKIHENISDLNTLLELLIHLRKMFAAHLVECQKKLS
uniref:Bet v I/Major latex protein domain-containing protein n=1 Tax=Manihot esculenta TaxID=3983 RepID=A0A2C9U604_MANES